MKPCNATLASDDTGAARNGDFGGHRPQLSLTRMWRFVAHSGILVCGIIVGQLAYAATPIESPSASAVSVNGTQAKLNGVPMTAGATLFPGDVVVLGGSSAAALQFGKNLVVAMSSTEFVVSRSGLSLRNGRIQVRTGSGESFEVSGPFFNLNIASRAAGASSADVRVGDAHAQVSAITGSAELNAAGSDVLYTLHAGETAVLDSTAPDAWPGSTTADPQPNTDADKRYAGKVTSLVPQVQIDRASVRSIANVSNEVEWNDDLLSGPTGRARIALKDGSLLSLGSNSQMRVLQHDAKAQQTTLELTVGRMRGQIVKLTRPGSKFEIRTPMGVAGLVGTATHDHMSPSWP